MKLIIEFNLNHLDLFILFFKDFIKFINIIFIYHKKAKIHFHFHLKIFKLIVIFLKDSHNLIFFLLNYVQFHNDLQLIMLIEFNYQIKVH